MPAHKKQSDVEAAGRRTDKGNIEQLDSAGQGLPVEEDTYVSKSEGISGQNVGRLTRPV